MYMKHIYIHIYKRTSTVTCIHKMTYTFRHICMHTCLHISLAISVKNSKSLQEKRKQDTKKKQNTYINGILFVLSVTGIGTATCPSKITSDIPTIFGKVNKMYKNKIINC